jgi:hypothetical protein
VRRLIRKSLYREVASNYAGLILFLAPEKLKLLEQRFVQNIRDYAQTSAFDYAKTQQEIVLGMKEWSAIEQIYKSLKRIIDKPGVEIPDMAFPEGYAVAVQQGIGVISAIEEAVLGGTLSIRMLSRVTPDITPRLSEIQRGKRRRSLEIYEEIERGRWDELLK